MRTNNMRKSEEKSALCFIRMAVVRSFLAHNTIKYITDG